MFANPQTLVLSTVLRDTLNGPEAADELGPATLHAAVYAWMEGHVEGEGREGTPSLPTETRSGDPPMPSPPFPSPDDQHLRAIVRETNERFAGAEPLAAALFASGLAYQAGLEEGAHCSGCVARAGSGGLRDAARIRAGDLPLTLSAGVPSLVDTSPGRR